MEMTKLQEVVLFFFLDVLGEIPLFCFSKGFFCSSRVNPMNTSACFFPRHSLSFVQTARGRNHQLQIGRAVFDMKDNIPIL